MTSAQASEPSYAAAHSRVRKEFGPASAYDCEVCLNPADEWAYVGPRTGINPHGNPEDYRALCRKHHRELDRATRKARKKADAANQDFLF